MGDVLCYGVSPEDYEAHEGVFILQTDPDRAPYADIDFNLFLRQGCVKIILLVLVGP